MIRRMVAERGNQTPNLVIPDWVLWSLRLWTDDFQIEANVRMLANHIIHFTEGMYRPHDKYADESIPLADALLSGTATQEDVERIAELRALYEAEYLKPPVYFALGSNIGEQISDIGMSAFCYAGVCKIDLILHYESLLLAFVEHDHNHPFNWR